MHISPSRHVAFASVDDSCISNFEDASCLRDEQTTEIIPDAGIASSLDVNSLCLSLG